MQLSAVASVWPRPPQLLDGDLGQTGDIGARQIFTKNLFERALHDIQVVHGAAFFALGAQNQPDHPVGGEDRNILAAEPTVEVAYALLDIGFEDPPEDQGSPDPNRPWIPQHEFGQKITIEHLLHLPRRARQNRQQPAAEIDEHAGSGAAIVVQQPAAFDDPGHRGCVDRHLASASGVSVADPPLELLAVTDRPIEGEGDTIAGDVIGRRTEASRDHHEVVSGEKITDGCRDPVDIIPDDPLLVHGDAVTGKGAGDGQRVSVELLVAEQLRTDRETGRGSSVFAHGCLRQP